MYKKCVMNVQSFQMAQWSVIPQAETDESGSPSSPAAVIVKLTQAALTQDIDE